MRLTGSFNTAVFKSGIRELAQRAGVTAQRAVDFETARTLDRCIELTPMSSAASVAKSYSEQLFVAYLPEIYNPKKPFKGELTRNGYKRFFLMNKYPQQLWDAIEAKRARSLAIKFAAVGVARKSWWQLARMLGLEVRGGRFTKAIGDQSQDFAISRTASTNGAEIVFINRQPTINRIPDGWRVLRQAMAGRAKYFEKNVEKGVFDDMQEVAKKYPGLIVK